MLSRSFWNRLSGVVVITPVLHTGGRRFDPGLNQLVFLVLMLLCWYHWGGPRCVSLSAYLFKAYLMLTGSYLGLRSPDYIADALCHVAWH